MPRTVIHCINSFSSLAGGVSFALQSLCDHVEGVRHVILALRDSEPTLATDNATVYLFNRIGPYAFSYSHELEEALSEMLDKMPNTIVHIHGMWSGLGYSINLIRKRHGTHRYIVSPHGMLAPNAVKRRKIVKSIMHTLWEGNVLKNAAGIHCLTKTEQTHVKQFNKNLKTFVLPHSIWFPLSEAMLKESWLARATEQKTLLYLGRVHKTKGVIQLVREIVERSKTSARVNFRLKIAGFGPQSEIDALNAMIGTDSNISFLGSVFGEDKKQQMLASHAMILPSMTEGLPMTLMEGAAHGLPLLVTNECNLDWVEVQGAGKSVPYGTSGIKELVDFFHQSSINDLETMGLNSARSARSLYSVESISDQWRELYENL